MTMLDFEPAVARAPPPAVQERDYISWSAVKLYQQCPLRYFFKYIAGLPEETVSASLVFGSAIHRALELHFRQLMEGQPAPTLGELLAEYRAGWDDYRLPIRFGKEDDRASLGNLAQRMLTAFAASDLARPIGRILAVEETLRGSIIPGLPDVLGRIDLMVETPDELVVSDWKTSRARYSREQVEDSTEQLLLYSELAKDIAPGKAVRLEFAVLTKTKEVQLARYSAPADQRRVDRTKRVIERVWRAIEAGHFYPAPSQTNCPGCPFRGPCQKWYG